MSTKEHIFQVNHFSVVVAQPVKGATAKPEFDLRIHGVEEEN